MASVYLARERALQRLVAIKVFTFSAASLGDTGAVRTWPPPESACRSGPVSRALAELERGDRGDVRR